jgi:hypothetical protein
MATPITIDVTFSTTRDLVIDTSDSREDGRFAMTRR